MGAQESQPKVKDIVLKTDAEHIVEIGQNSVTTLQFPEAVEAVIGHDLAMGKQKGKTSAQVEHLRESKLVILRSFGRKTESRMTVLMNGKLYLFLLKWSESPDLIIRCHALENVKEKSDTDNSVDSSGIRVETTFLEYLSKLAEAEAEQRKKHPMLYQDVVSRAINKQGDSGPVQVTVESVHRFEKNDTLVLVVSLRNENGQTYVYDKDLLKLKVGTKHFPVSYTNATGEIPASSTMRFSVLLVGNGRNQPAHISIENAFQILMPKLQTAFTARKLEK